MLGLSPKLMECSANRNKVLAVFLPISAVKDVSVIMENRSTHLA